MARAPQAAAGRFAELFGSVYLHFHRRDPKRSLLTPQSWAVLQHLALAGPLTVTEAARHLERAQSVVSTLVDGLEAKGLLARVRDARDRRRTLVWLTDKGHRALEAERQVLCPQRLAAALARLPVGERDRLLGALEALVTVARKLDRTQEDT